MLKYDTFGALLAGEGLADGAWFHISPEVATGSYIISRSG